MADVSLGTFQVTAMSQMSAPPLGTLPTYNMAMTQVDAPAGAGPGTITMSGLAGEAPAAFAITDVQLGKQYEVILREVAGATKPARDE